MLRLAVVSLAAAAALAGCESDSKDPNWNPPRVVKRDQPAKQPKKVEQTAGAEDKAPAPAGSVEERLARLERKVDKITGFLKQAVPPKLDDSLAYAVPIDPADPVIGPKDAKVTIVEAYEYLCPYCTRVAPIMDQLAAEYPKDVRIVSKYFVIHGEPAVPSGQGACAAGKQGKYDQYQKAVWKRAWPTQQPDRNAITAEAVVALAGELGMDTAKFKADMEGDCKQWIGRSMQTLQKFGAGGTPSFYINGRFAQGGDLATFKRIVDDEIAKVNESGVAPAKYYDEVVVGQGAPEAVMVSPFDD